MVDEKNDDKICYQARYEVIYSELAFDESIYSKNRSILVRTFKADSESQALALAINYNSPRVRFIELTELVQIKHIPLSEKVIPPKQTPKEVYFDIEKRSLVDEQGNLYKGTRFDKATAESFGSSKIEDARRSALEKIVDQAAAKNADAFEITHVEIHDSHQEYDSTPYSATAQALLYQIIQK